MSEETITFLSPDILQAYNGYAQYRINGGIRTQKPYSCSNQLKFSIITVVYNGADTLSKTIESVLAQDYPHIEYILVDGASTDGTLDIIRSFDDRIDLWISEKDAGIYHALNRGISLATGDFIGILHANDILASANVISRIGAQVCPEYRAYAGETIMTGKSGEVRFPFQKNHKLYFQVPFMHPSLYVKREIYEEYGLFDLSYLIASDVDFILRIMSSGEKIVDTDIPVLYMDDGGLSSQNFVQAREEYRKIYLRYYRNYPAGWYGFLRSLLVHYVRMTPLRRIYRFLRRVS